MWTTINGQSGTSLYMVITRPSQLSKVPTHLKRQSRPPSGRASDWYETTVFHSTLHTAWLKVISTSIGFVGNVWQTKQVQMYPRSDSEFESVRHHDYRDILVITNSLPNFQVIL